MLGTFNPLAKTQDAASAPPWAVYNQMKEFFEITRVHEKTKSLKSVARRMRVSRVLRGQAPRFLGGGGRIVFFI